MQPRLRPPAVESHVAISRRMKAPSTFRLDRALSLSVAKPLLRLTEDPRTSKLPILMYHGISDETGDRHPYYETNTSPSRFAEQMRYLHEEGYRIVGLDTISDCMKAERPAERRVVITFDDGYRNFFSTALPILAAHGFSATVFVVSGYAQQASICDQSRVHMNWSEVREISRCGMAVGSHTVSHCVLRDLAPGSLRYELNESKRVIESAPVVTNKRQKTRVVFLGKRDSISIKLIEPTSDDSPLAAFARKGGGLHHLAFRCDDLPSAIPHLKKAGARILVAPEPGEAFCGHPIAFALVPGNLNIELIDTEEKYQFGQAS